MTTSLPSSILEHPKVDTDHLKLPAMFHSVVAGLTVLGTTVKRTSQHGFCANKSKAFAIRRSAFLILYAMTTGFSTAQNWFPTSAPEQSWTAIAPSSDGNKLVAVSSEVPGNNYGYIFTSTNGGASWMQTSAPSEHWVCAASSADGQNCGRSRLLERSDL